MYERRGDRLLSRMAFARRLARHVAISSVIVAGSLLGGMLGFVHLEGLGWLDAFLNAAMLLSGMGPLGIPSTDAGKVFAGLYALYSGIVFVVVASIIVAPVVHRILHKFHWTDAR